MLSKACFIALGLHSVLGMQGVVASGESDAGPSSAASSQPASVEGLNSENEWEEVQPEEAHEPDTSNDAAIAQA